MVLGCQHARTNSQGRHTSHGNAEHAQRCYVFAQERPQNNNGVFIYTHVGCKVQFTCILCPYVGRCPNIFVCSPKAQEEMQRMQTNSIRIVFVTFVNCLRNITTERLLKIMGLHPFGELFHLHNLSIFSCL